jgi:MarR family transcriptional regulator, organic hydroperoxide resistance regulator
MAYHVYYVIYHLFAYHTSMTGLEVRSSCVDPLFDFALTLKAASRYLEQLITDAMSQLGITAAQADALVVIGQTQPVSLKELGMLLIAEAGHPSRLVDRMVAAGWVERRSAGDDRRRVELSLTATGEEMRRSVEAARHKLIEFGRGLAPEREITHVVRLFSEVLATSAYAELLERRRALGSDERSTPLRRSRRRSSERARDA